MSDETIAQPGRDAPAGALRGTFTRPPGRTDPDWPALRALALRDFRPRSRLQRTITRVDTPAVPAIDVHNHLGRWLSEDGGWMTPDLGELLRLMDECGIERIVNLDGRWGEELRANLDRYDRAHPGRFATFCHLDWRPIAAGAGPQEFVRQVEEAAGLGARGIKIWKDLGLAVRDDAGTLVLPDDDRVIAACRRAGELGMVVLIHTADPVAFFDPVDATNERLEELAAAPEWWFGDPDRFPGFDRLLSALVALVAAAPGTPFIGAHVGGYAENLSWVAAVMTEHANFHVDLGGRLAELGRQPRAFARLVAAHPDRVLFGSDAFPAWAPAYRNWFRFLESDDECWPYDGEDCAGEVPGQGRWTVAGAQLPPAALRAVYRDNALRLGL